MSHGSFLCQLPFFFFFPYSIDAASTQEAPALQRDWRSVWSLFRRWQGHKDEFTIIPVLVGALSESKEQEFGKLFSKYLADPSNLFVVSSDFCHWGQRFRYSYYDESQGEIYRSIEHLDKMGMSIIEQLDPVSFSNYLKKYHNTICGRHPIGVLLNAITELQKSGMNMSFSFLNYAQSSQCRSWQDSSVSYAAGALTVHWSSDPQGRHLHRLVLCPGSSLAFTKMLVLVWGDSETSD